MPKHVDLDVVGTTHRAYTDAKDAVRYRKAPKKPEQAKEPFDQAKWLAEQQALTDSMSAMYFVDNNTSKALPKQGRAKSAEYVPKVRKTQRAVQKPRQRQHSRMAYMV